MTFENSDKPMLSDAVTPKPETLPESIKLLRDRIQQAKTTITEFSTSLQAANAEIQRLHESHAMAITKLTDERDQMAAERDEMYDRLERIVSRLRLMGLEHSRYE